MQRVTKLFTFIGEGQTDARAAAIVRMLVGLAMIGNALEHWVIMGRLIMPAVVKMPYVAWLPRPTPAGLLVLIGLWLVAAVLFILGSRTRLAGAVLVAIMSYVLLLDQQLYSNHLYLGIIVTFLLTLADSSGRFSLDARYAGRRDQIAAWPILLLKLQISIVYFFAALTKINPAYLDGTIMAQFFQADTLKLLPSGLPIAAVLQALAVLSIATEFFLAFALWFAGWRWLALVVGIGFHLMIIFTGGSTFGVPDIPFAVFAFLTVAPYVLFFRLPTFTMRANTSAENVPV